MKDAEMERYEAEQAERHALREKEEAEVAEQVSRSEEED
jgi:hypothetical protein